ncbi:PepSY domain-containing protein [Aureliella helgolandensis]|uniref:PepSY-associated TM helix n=1 Tax=Aureliella helgolandensis TaxID=2527968 RepID=A0A518G085_9BACT|nr:PepSY domain-containing protein [Aureliella helgolandensis]QDV21934.1 hypothetical protein Q31a_02130 [Aureliella helgolandensis]
MLEKSQPTSAAIESKRRTRKFWSRLTILVRRVHLYAGLFLLPWVFMYGVTGAMYNHQTLFPEGDVHTISSDVVAKLPIAGIAAPDEIARQVVEALQAAAPDDSVELDTSHAAEFTSDIIFEVPADGDRHVVHMDPVGKGSWVATYPKNPETPVALLKDVRNLKLAEDPYVAARKSVADILGAAGIEAESAPKSVGWSKLNFLANVNGEQAKVTYVLRDGHVDVTRYAGEDGMTLRAFLLRLHTSHGTTPHWNGRMFWSLIVDIMAIAMVSWGVTGLIMWWTIKRTRRVGSVVMLLSVATAAAFFFAMEHFYATTTL